jgi:hypothetical protein
MSPSTLSRRDLGPNRRIELRYAGYESAALPSKLIRRTMEPPPGFEPGPVEYKSTDLPVNRQRQSSAGVLPLDHARPKAGAGIRTRVSGSLERYTRLELVYADWQSAVLATGRIPRTYGAEYGSPTRLTGLEDQHLGDRPTPQRHTYPVVKQLTTQLAGTAGFEPASPASEAGKISQTPLRPVVQNGRDARTRTEVALLPKQVG